MSQIMGGEAEEDNVHHQHWGYTKENGPDNWHKEYPEACGLKQSPIDLSSDITEKVHPDPPLKFTYRPERGMTVTNTGHNWKVDFKEQLSVLTGGPLKGQYVLVQFHCHWGTSNDNGSEHTINGKKYAAELHFVHWNASKYENMEQASAHSDGIAVIGIFLECGRQNFELDRVVRYMRCIPFKDQTIEIDGEINPANFIPPNSGYFTYEGSLTTPPCSECVIWIVFQKPIGVSHDQLNVCRLLKSYTVDEECPADEHCGLLRTNTRPTLPINDREVKEFQPPKRTCTCDK